MASQTPLDLLFINPGDMHDWAKDPPRETDASLRAERRNVDGELTKRIRDSEAEADAVLKLARERADRLLEAARAAADLLLPISEQTQAAVTLLLDERAEQDRTVAMARAEADSVLERERAERRRKLAAQVVLERQATDVNLAQERTTADRAVASRDEFLAQASHDLRGLLGAQKIHLSLLAKLASDDIGSTLAKHVAALVTIESHMDRLVSDLVDIAAIEAGKLNLALRVESAAELLETVTAVFAPLAREREQTLSVSAPPADLKVVVDPERGVQVVGNLLSNAIKFTPRGGEIRLSLEATNDRVTFVVADDGPGVPGELAPHIFERFVGSTSSPRGLGLFIAARLAEAHGGRLSFDRERTEGSEFRFALRRAAPSE